MEKVICFKDVQYGTLSYANNRTLVDHSPFVLNVILAVKQPHDGHWDALCCAYSSCCVQDRCLHPVSTWDFIVTNRVSTNCPKSMQSICVELNIIFYTSNLGFPDDS